MTSGPWRRLSVAAAVVATGGLVVGSVPVAHAQGPHDVGLDLTVSGPENFYPDRVAFEASATVFCTEEDLLPLTETEITFTAETKDPWAHMDGFSTSGFVRVNPEICLSGEPGPTWNESVILRWLPDQRPEAFVPVAVDVSASLHKHTADGSTTTYGPVNAWAAAVPDYVPGVFLRPDGPQEPVRPGQRFEIELDILNHANGASVVRLATTTENTHLEAGSPAKFTLRGKELIQHTVTLTAGDQARVALMNFTVHGTSAQNASAGNASYWGGYAVHVTHLADSPSFGLPSTLFGAALVVTFWASRSRRTS